MRELVYKIDEKFEGKQVQQLLKHYGYSKAIITSLKQEDKLLCNGSHIRTVDYLKNGDILTVKMVDTTDLIPNPSLKIPIVYEDDDIVVFNKPPFMPVHPSLKHYDDTLANYFTYLYPEIAFRSVNRLDRNTSGLVIVAKNQLSSAQLCGNQIYKPKKFYYAVVKGNLIEKYGSSGEIIAPIARISDSIINREVRLGGQYAHTVFKVVKSNKDMSLLEIFLPTGRTHQIRVHFSYIGNALLGDDLYCGDTTLINRQALHCGKAMFTHPVTKKNIIVSAPFPNDIQKIIDLI